MIFLINFELNHVSQTYPGSFVFLLTTRVPLLPWTLILRFSFKTPVVSFFLQIKSSMDWLSSNTTFLKSNWSIASDWLCSISFLFISSPASKVSTRCICVNIVPLYDSDSEMSNSSCSSIFMIFFTIAAKYFLVFWSSFFILLTPLLALLEGLERLKSSFSSLPLFKTLSPDLDLQRDSGWPLSTHLYHSLYLQTFCCKYPNHHFSFGWISCLLEKLELRKHFYYASLNNVAFLDELLGIYCHPLCNRHSDLFSDCHLSLNYVLDRRIPFLGIFSDQFFSNKTDIFELLIVNEQWHPLKWHRIFSYQPNYVSTVNLGIELLIPLIIRESVLMKYV